MFKSATIQLTGWYLLILMTISVFFSVAIYHFTTDELSQRLSDLEARVERRESDMFNGAPPPVSQGYSAFRTDQADQAKQNILNGLLYVNLFILLSGGAGSYFLARRTLRPIEQAHEAQSRFTSDASHELRTPLAVMKTELEVAMRDSDLAKSEMRELLASNLEEVNKLSNLAQTLLQLSRLDHGKLEQEELSLNHVVHDIIRKYDKSGERISFTPSSKDHTIYANLASIEELVTILVDNALKYSPNDSLVTTTTSLRSGKACFEITNTGDGISEKDLPHIFDRFYRADTARTKNKQTGGHGLGLSLAAKIVELHKGELSASSAPGHATTFTVLLPIYKSPAKSQ